MNINKSDDFVAFTDAQLITATSSFAAAVSELRKNVSVKHLTDREGHAIMLLGTRATLARNGVPLDPMTATRFVGMLQEEFGISDTAAENDCKRLKDAGIVDGVPSAEDGRVREIVLSDLGERLYRELAERAASLILAAAELLQGYGAVPADPIGRAKPYLRNYALRIRKQD